MIQEENLRKNMIWNAVGPFVYSLHSLFFLIIVTRINGIDSAGIFSFAFSFSCLLICIGNYATRAFQVTETDTELNDFDFIYHRFITCTIMIVAGIIYAVIIRSDVYELAIIVLLVLYKVVESFSEVVYAVIQKHDDLYRVGISFFTKGWIGICTFLLVNIVTEDLILSIVALLVAMVTIFILYDIKVMNRYRMKRKKVKVNNIKKIFFAGFHPCLFTFLSIYVINASRYAIERLLLNEDQTIFGILIMPTTILVLVSQFLIHPFLLRLKQSYERKDKSAFVKLVFRMSGVVVGIGIVGEIGAWIVGIPFLELIYGVHLETYKVELLLIILGAIIYAVTYILSVALTTLRSTKVQSIIFASVAVVTTILAHVMTMEWGITGAVYTYVITMVVLLLFYVIAFCLSSHNKFCDLKGDR